MAGSGSKALQDGSRPRVMDGLAHPNFLTMTLIRPHSAPFLSLVKPRFLFKAAHENQPLGPVSPSSEEFMAYPIVRAEYVTHVVLLDTCRLTVLQNSREGRAIAVVKKVTSQETAQHQIRKP
ncbi:cellular nucleic acid-binding protein [Moniliophthora roreri]|nr:cellular nucleic acid-binding protein [Moniliophthora roreri]